MGGVFFEERRHRADRKEFPHKQTKRRKGQRNESKEDKSHDFRGAGHHPFHIFDVFSVMGTLQYPCREKSNALERA
jgi:hypothetical protein